jgi:hypothetical protein
MVSHETQDQPGGRKMTGAAARADQVLVVNAGSSTLKLRVLGPADEITAALDLDPWDGHPEHDELGRFLGGLSGVWAWRSTGPATMPRSPMRRSPRPARRCTPWSSPPGEDVEIARQARAVLHTAPTPGA